MTRKLTTQDWDVIQQSRPARYFVQSIEDGDLRVTFKSEMFVTEKGDEDILGNVWDKEWDKIEARAIVRGEPKIYSFGGRGWSFSNDFIDICRANDIPPENLPGCTFIITKTGDWTQEFKYVGREDGVKSDTSNNIEIKENILRDAKEVINNLKENSPDLVAIGLSKEDFLKVAKIRGKINPTDMEKILPELEKQSLITFKDNKIFF